MRIVREQMLCIVSPGWPAGIPSAQQAEALERLCRSVGIIHFAALALLPPLPEDEKGAHPALLLELVVDEGLRPCDTLSHLAYHPSGTLWDLYCAFPALRDAAANGTAGERNEALLGHLLAHLSVPDGAFVGPRDLPVAQIRQERELSTAVREHAAAASSALVADRDGAAAELARLVAGQQRFAWVASPSPRSFWRGAGRSPTVRLGGLAAVVLGGVCGAVWLLLFGLHLTLAAGERLATWAGLHGASLGGLSGFVHAAPQAVVAAGLRFLAVVGIAGLGLAALIVVPGWVFAGWREWFRRLDRELDRPTTTWSAWAAHWFGWLLAVAVLLALAEASAYVILGSGGLLSLVAHLRGWPAWALFGLAGVAGALFVVLLLGLRTRAEIEPTLERGRIVAALNRLKQSFHRPHDEVVERAQQVHPSIEACEAELVGGTARMMSLTDLRRPYAWSAWWTRLVLRTVTFLGYTLYPEGRLGSIPGIQYAHWHIVQGGRRFLFCANFDGTFGGYLDDFIKGPSAGTTLFWRWTQLRPRPAAAPGHPQVAHARRFPPTRLVVYRGVKCELRFKAYARESMLPHLARFDAALGVSSGLKMRANRLRDALGGERTLVKDDIIMRSIES